MKEPIKRCYFFSQDCHPVECLAGVLTCINFIDKPNSPNGLDVVCAMGNCAEKILNAIELPNEDDSEK